MWIATLIDKMDANGYVVAGAQGDNMASCQEALRKKVVDGKMSFSTYEGKVTVDSSTFYDAVEGIDEDWVVEVFEL